jgi:ADP-heptose:LPS heptosyltransferase
MARPLGKILVIRGGAIGDFILTLPAIAALRAQFPGVRLEVLGYPHIASLALAGGLVDGVQPIESRALASFFVPEGDLPPALANYFAGFAIIVSYLYDPDGHLRGNISRCSGAQFIAGPHRPSEAEPVHATEVFLKPLERLAIFGAEPVPRLAMEGTPFRHPSAAGKPILAVHPGSGSERKNWPEKKWAALLAAVLDTTEARLLLVGGEAEGARLERLAASLPLERVMVARSRPLPELARSLSGCVAFVGHDSGITHMAAALGLPGLVLWGPSHAAVWRPLSPVMEILRTPGGIEAVSVADVFARLSRFLPDARSQACPAPPSPD